MRGQVSPGAKGRPGLPLTGKSRCAGGGYHDLTAALCSLGSELTSPIKVPFSRPPRMSRSRQALLRLSEGTPVLGKDEWQPVQSQAGSTPSAQTNEGLDPPIWARDRSRNQPLDTQPPEPPRGPCTVTFQFVLMSF